MISNLFTVYDAAAKKYLEPFHAPTIEFAIRQFRETCSQPNHMFGKFPEDYALFHIGEFSLETGLIEPNAAPHHLGSALSFLPTIENLRNAEPIQLQEAE